MLQNIYGFFFFFFIIRYYETSKTNKKYAYFLLFGSVCNVLGGPPIYFLLRYIFEHLITFRTESRKYFNVTFEYRKQ